MISKTTQKEHENYYRPFLRRSLPPFFNQPPPGGTSSQADVRAKSSLPSLAWFPQSVFFGALKPAVRHVSDWTLLPFFFVFLEAGLRHVSFFVSAVLALVSCVSLLGCLMLRGRFSVTA